MKFQYGDLVWVRTDFYNKVPGTVIGFHCDPSMRTLQIVYEVRLPHSSAGGRGKIFKEGELELYERSPFPA